MKLTVHLITWNGAKYVPHLFASLRQQTFKDWMLLVVDNHSEDGMVEKMKNELNNFSFPYKLIENHTNLGFAPGHNQAYQNTDGEYFLLLNQDMYLEPDCLEKMVKFLDTHPEAAAVSPRLMRWNFGLVASGEPLEKSFTNQIDALGLKVFRNRRVIERETQEEWNKDKYGDKDYEEVFGVSGAFPMYRRSAIKAVEFSDHTFLDETYHSYKEDVDLSFRLRERGFRSFVIFNTVAFHDRAGAGPKDMLDTAAAENKKQQSAWVRYHSYKNHLRTLYKNEYWQNFLLDFPWIFWYELKKLVWYILFDRKVLKGLGEVFKNRKDLFKKHLAIKQARTVSWRDLRKWWIN